MDPNKYTYKVSWSADDQEYVASVLEFPSLSWLSEDRRNAKESLADLVREVIVDMQETGETIPQPLG